MSVRAEAGLTVGHSETTIEGRGEGRDYLTRGALAGLVAAAAVAVVAAVADLAGISFEIRDAGQRIPFAAFPQSALPATIGGLLPAAALLRWSRRPARFVQATVALTGVSPAPPFALGADGCKTPTLVTLHLPSTAIVIPAVAARLDPGARHA